MSLTYASPSQTSSLTRTLQVWLLSNLGGTGLLVADFGFERPEDLAVPLLIGLMAGLISLGFVPLAYPFFALSRRVCAGWRCRLVALTGVTLVFALGNYLLLSWLPIGSFENLISFSRPYLGAALLAVAWLYRPQAAAKPASLKPTRAAALTSIWWSRSIRQTMAH